MEDKHEQLLHGLDVGQHAALGDGDPPQQLVELLVVAHGQLQVARDDPSLLVVAGRVAGQLQDLGGQVLQDGRQVHGGSGPDALRVVSFTQQPVHAAHGELEPRTGGAGGILGSSRRELGSSRRGPAAGGAAGGEPLSNQEPGGP
ncbi:unnamed protein product [Menidia menidia]|uniref:(Atlantic silverside) hypothetical protein n=1 Tax=Menidia menidia TaxID=238744 RepID=A0A8S4B8C5_9TELE|nr:unnamed protein product [Menidia menidia]